jgi:hypothetical protein
MVFPLFEQLGAPDIRKETFRNNTFITLGVTISQRCSLESGGPEGPKGVRRDRTSPPREPLGAVWLAGLLAGLLACWLARWLAGWLTGWLVVGWLAQMADGWPAGGRNLQNAISKKNSNLERRGRRCRASVLNGIKTSARKLADDN